MNEGERQTETPEKVENRNLEEGNRLQAVEISVEISILTKWESRG